MEYVASNQIAELTPKILEAFFHHCKKDLNYSYSMMKQLLASVKFFYEAIQEAIDFDLYIKMKKPSHIPVVLSVKKVQRLLNSFTNIKHKAIFTPCYSAAFG